MRNEMELQQIIFNMMETQIKFGVYRCGDSLPTIKEASSFFLASVDTIRLAYVRLKQEGYISLGTCVGATVKVQYSEEEIREHIQSYFSCRKSAILDLARSIKPLFGYAQWAILTNASPTLLDDLERSNQGKAIPPPYRMSQQYRLLYSSLGNDIYMRLIWQMFLFFQAPFLGIPHNIKYLELETHPPHDVLMDLIRLCREKDWEGLKQAIDDYEGRRFHALRQFFDTEIRSEPNMAQLKFSWSPYKKASQLCYSICMELMMKIRKGEYPAGSFLPSLGQIAQERKVSLNTVRRTLHLLGKLGAVQSINGVGTKVLPLLDCSNHCDFTDEAIQKCLLNFAQGFQILALSCRACSKLTINSMDADSIEHWIKKLEEIKRIGIYEDVIITCYEAISIYAPYQAIRTVYNELVQQLFWGAPLRDLHGDRESTKDYFSPYLNSLIDCLTRVDAEGFSKKLEELQMRETSITAKYLTDLGIQEAAVLSSGKHCAGISRRYLLGNANLNPSQE